MHLANGFQIAATTDFQEAIGLLTFGFQSSAVRDLVWLVPHWTYSDYQDLHGENAASLGLG
jgi:hypothetical protein